LLVARPNLKAASDLVHTDVVVQMHDKPSQALRKGRGASMWLQSMHKERGADAPYRPATGALMAMAKLSSDYAGIGALPLRRYGRRSRGKPSCSISVPRLGRCRHLVNLSAMAANGAGAIGIERPEGCQHRRKKRGLSELASRLPLREGGRTRYYGFVEGMTSAGDGGCGGDEGHRQHRAQPRRARRASSAHAQARARRTLATRLGCCGAAFRRW
jgi:glycerol-3-phosphate acyltransferase PlsX